MVATRDASWKSGAAASCSVIASAAKQSSLPPRRDSGLLRGARNDDVERGCATFALVDAPLLSGALQSRNTSASGTAPRLLAIHHLRRHRFPRARGELPPPSHDYHGCRGYEQHPGADEPAEIAECEEEGALAAVEMAAGGFEQARGADHMSFGLRRVTLRGCRHAAEQDRDIVEQAVRPGEFEEGVDADQDKADAFQ